MTDAIALAFAIVTCRWEPGELAAVIQALQNTPDGAVALVAIASGSWEPGERDAVIQALQNTPDGAETLRLIVKDDILGAANTVCNALWPVFANL